MFTIYAGNNLLYSSEFKDPETSVLTPTCTVEMGRASSLSFIVMPEHYMYHTFVKLRTVVTAFINGKEIFRGRLLDWSADIFKQKAMTCEGNLSYLIDSLQPPRNTTKTVKDYFGELLYEHNIQVESGKRFEIGVVTIDEAQESVRFENNTYRYTRDAFDTDLISQYGGYLVPRQVGNKTYLDYIKDYSNMPTKRFDVGSDIIDVSEQVIAANIFTVLLPTGPILQNPDESQPSWPMIISEANGGSKLLENMDGIEKFGRIMVTQNFEDATSPEDLKEKAEAYFAKNYVEPNSKISLKAIDMGLIDTSLDVVQVGTRVILTSPDTGQEIERTCLKITYDFSDPTNTIFELGDPEDESPQSISEPITQQLAQTSGGKGGGKVGGLYKSITETADLTKIENKRIELKAEEDLRLKGDEIWVEAENLINMKADTIMLDAATLIQGESEIINFWATEQLNLKVSKENIIQEINMSSEGIKISGTKVMIEGSEGIIMQGDLTVYGNITQQLADLDSIVNGTLTTWHVNAPFATLGMSSIGQMDYKGTSVSWFQESALSTTTSLTVTKDVDGFVTDVTLNKSDKTFTYLGSW